MKAWVFVALLWSQAALATAIDFTRFLFVPEQEDAALVRHETRFSATAGPARLSLNWPQSLGVLDIKLNGATLAVPSGQSEVAVVLQPSNLIVLSLAEGSAGRSAADQFEVRIRQRAEVELNVISRVHFNTNVSDFTAAREFYGKLGFTTLTGFPDTNTQAMARAIGITTPTQYDGSAGGEAGGYQLHGELIGLGFMSGSIDLIEFSIPRDESPPYARLNHLGMARAVFYTTDIDADYAYMRGLGVDMLSAPVARATRQRFLIFKDLDGTFYELREHDGDVEDTETTHISEFGPLNINVSDLERSQAWYQMMGHSIGETTFTSPTTEVANALGFTQEVAYVSSAAVLPGDGSSLELVQWVKPTAAERAYPLPVNHLGIHRTAFATSDIEADVATLVAQGVELVSPITPCCSGPDSSGRIIAFYDPDGTIVELVEQPAMNWVLPVLLWFRDTF